MRQKLHRFAAVAGLWGILAPTVLSAQNLLVNPHFDTDLSGWGDPLLVGWDGAHDAGGSPASGSAESFRFFDGPNSCIEPLFQCVSGLSGGTRYDFGGQIIIPNDPNQTTGGQGAVGVHWYSDTCGGTLIGSTFGPVVDSTAAGGAWTASDTAGMTSPAGTTSALIVGRSCIFGVGNLEMFWDDMFFRPTPAFDAAVPALDRRGIVLLALLLAGAGLLALRRLAG